MELSLEETDLPNHSTLVKAFDRIKMAIWRVLLRLSARCTSHQLTLRWMQRFSTGKTLANTTAVARTTAFRHSKQPLSSIQSHKLSSTFTIQPRNVMTRRPAGKGYNWQQLRYKLEKEDVKPLIKHRGSVPSITRITRCSMGPSTVREGCLRPSSK